MVKTRSGQIYGQALQQYQYQIKLQQIEQKRWYINHYKKMYNSRERHEKILCEIKQCMESDLKLKELGISWNEMRRELWDTFISFYV